MNVWEEAYPEDFEHLFKNMKESSATILSKLHEPVCAKLSTIFERDEKQNKMLLSKIGKALFNPLYNIKKGSASLNEIKGLYLFGEQTADGLKPVYVGISGTIVRRLRQHCWGKEHNQASLAYLMAKKELGHDSSRISLERIELIKQQEIIRDFKFVLFPETDNYKLYLLEVFLSGVLKTKWNSFKTH